jgi:ABC-type nitrate/sulfonate/bicarbonate transport system substrate-binding protein
MPKSRAAGWKAAPTWLSRRQNSGMARHNNLGRCGLLIGALVALAVASASRDARAADVLRVGKSPGFLFAYVPVDVGLAKGMFQKRSLELEIVDFEGASKMDMALTADSIDLALGSPMEMAAIEKGMPALAIAAIAHPIRELAIIVPADSPITSLDGLRGKSIGIASVGSITQWAALELTRVKGWGPDGLKMVSIGSGAASGIAAIRAHLVDATVGNLMTGVVLEKQGQARRIALVSDYASDFIMHEISATHSALATKSDAIRAFMGGWFEAVAFMRANKAEAVRIASTVTGLSEADESVEYDLLMPELSSDGRHDSSAMERAARSFVELGILDHQPDMAKLYSEGFLSSP